MLVASCDAFWLREQRYGSGFALVMPTTALPVDFVSVFVVLDVLLTLAHHHLVAATRLDKLEGHVEGRRRQALSAGSFEYF